jgi:hypothetical protein
MPRAISPAAPVGRVMADAVLRAARVTGKLFNDRIHQHKQIEPFGSLFVCSNLFSYKKALS